METILNDGKVSCIEFAINYSRRRMLNKAIGMPYYGKADYLAFLVPDNKFAIVPCISKYNLKRNKLLFERIKEMIALHKIKIFILQRVIYHPRSKFILNKVNTFE